MLLFKEDASFQGRWFGETVYFFYLSSFLFFSYEGSVYTFFIYKLFLYISFGLHLFYISLRFVAKGAFFKGAFFIEG